MTSLPARPVVITCSWDQVSMYLAGFLAPAQETMPPSRPGVPQVGSPGSAVLWGTATPYRPSRRTSLPSLGDTIVAFPDLSPQPRNGGWGLTWSWSAGLPPAWTMETAGPPKFPGIPPDPMPCSPTPAGPDTRLGPRVNGSGAAPASKHNEGAPRGATFGAQSHGLWSGCLRLAGSVTPPPRKTRFRLLVPARPGGIRTRRVPLKGFWISRSFLLSRTSWR